MTGDALTQLRQAVVARALSNLGKPYYWGGVGPDDFDCSGEVLDALKNNAVADAYQSKERLTTEDWWLGGATVGALLASFDDRLAGDVVVYAPEPGTYHVMMVQNHDWLVGARGGGAPKAGENDATYRARMEEVGAKVSVVTSTYWQSHRLGVIRPKALIDDQNVDPTAATV